MNKKVLYPLLIHLCLCIISYIIFRLIWMGPEGGLLAQYLPQNIMPMIFVLTCIMEIIIGIIYFFVGKKISSFSRYAILSICMIIIFEILCISIIWLIGDNIFDSFSSFAFMFGTPFMLLSAIIDITANNMHEALNIAIDFIPIILILIGNVYGYLRKSFRQG